ncbi:MAG: hypothetical protein AAGA77_20640, partial [Bacteroidota bacterium]
MSRLESAMSDYQLVRSIWCQTQGTEASGGAVLSSGMLTLMDVDIYDPTNNATSVIQTSMTGSLRIRGEV